MRMKMAAKFLEELQRACSRRGGQKALVAATGVTQPTLSRILNGGSEPALKTVSLLVDALGLELVHKGAPEVDERKNSIELTEALKKIEELKREVEGLHREMQGMDRALRLISGKPEFSENIKYAEKNCVPYEPKLPDRDVG